MRCVLFILFSVSLAQAAPTAVQCGFEKLVKKDELEDNQAVFNSDKYGGEAYERGVMAYGSREAGGGWWAVQAQSKAIVSDELGRLAGQGRKQAEILDIGSGPGFTLNEFGAVASQHPKIKVKAHGLEYNDKMVAYSREKYGADVQQGDMHALSSIYPKESVDIVHAQSVLWASDRPEKVAEEIGKIQKSGGICTFTWMVRRSESGGYDNHASWIDALSESVNASVAAGRISREQADGVLEANRKLVLGNNLNSPRDPEELKKIFAAQGYTIEKEIPQYPDTHGNPFFYQYVFRKR